jgi:hypothetical protein
MLMKRLLTLALVALLSLGVASVSLAQGGGTETAPAATKAPKKHKKHGKKHKKGKKTEGQAEGTTK